MQKILTGYDCLQCFVHQIDKVLRLTEFSEIERREIFLKSLNFLSNIKNWKTSPPEIARQVYDFLYTQIEGENPFKKIKDFTNKAAEEVLKVLVNSRKNLLFEDYVKFAVAGNIIDFGVGNSSRENFDNSKIVNLIKNFKFEKSDIENFYKELSISKSILYILDNSGEAIFDMALIEQIKKYFPKIEVYIAARNRNIINDISFEDAYALGFDRLGEVISTGYDGPGILLEKTSTKFRKLFKSVDVIISKGQGNFETLWGESRNIYYALKIKCNHVAKISGFKLNSNLFIKYR